VSVENSYIVSLGVGLLMVAPAFSVLYIVGANGCRVPQLKFSQVLSVDWVRAHKGKFSNTDLSVSLLISLCILDNSLTHSLGLSVCLLVRLSVCLPVCLPVRPSVRLSVRPSVSKGGFAGFATGLFWAIANTGSIHATKVVEVHDPKCWRETNPQSNVLMCLDSHPVPGHVARISSHPDLHLHQRVVKSGHIIQQLQYELAV
jgi:hypothetical protein